MSDTIGTMVLDDYSEPTSTDVLGKLRVVLAVFAVMTMFSGWTLYIFAQGTMPQLNPRVRCAWGKGAADLARFAGWVRHLPLISKTCRYACPVPFHDEPWQRFRSFGSFRSASKSPPVVRTTPVPTPFSVPRKTGLAQRSRLFAP